MTKKHFEHFARLIRQDLETANTDSRKMACQYAATVFATLASSDNPRFDVERFMRACGLGE